MILKTGTIILIPFPFAELTNSKIRPAIVVAHTKDKYEDVVLAAVSSQIPALATVNEMIVNPDRKNGLRLKSVIKVDRLFTLKKEKVIDTLGILNDVQIEEFKTIFKSLV